MHYEPIKFGVTNDVPQATLTSFPAPDTPLDWIKDERRGNLLRYTTPPKNILIKGTFDADRIAGYFALPGTNLSALSEIRLTLFEGENQSGRQVYSTGFVQVAEPPPFGEYEFGVDPWVEARAIDRPDVFVHFLPEATTYRSFELRLRRPDEVTERLDEVLLRMLLIGRSLQLDENFSHGSNAIRFYSDPELVETAGGSHILARGQRQSRVFSFALDMMSPDDRKRLRQMEKSLGGSAFIVSGYPNSSGWQKSDYDFLCRFGSGLSFGHDHPFIHSSGATLMEA